MTDIIFLLVVFQITDLTPLLHKSASIAASHPDNEAVHNLFRLMSDQWHEHVTRVRSLLDESVDAHLFIKACGV